MNACILLCVVNSGQWLCDKDGGHTIWSAITDNRMLHANLMAQCFINVAIFTFDIYDQLYSLSTVVDKRKLYNRKVINSLHSVRDQRSGNTGETQNLLITAMDQNNDAK